MSSSRAARRYTLNDLPQFSPWPARLLGLEPWAQKTKTPGEVAREYEVEKWGPLLDRMTRSETPFSLEQVDDWAREGARPSLCSLDKKFELLSAADAHARYLDLVEEVLKGYGPISTLVELGAGYGSIVLALAQRPAFSGARVFAAEYTAAGEEMLRRIGVAANLDLTVGHCDFASNGVVDLEIPPHAVVFTSYATPYVRKLDLAFVDSIRRFDPAIVVHFEPCYEHCDTDTTLGLLRRRYFEVNDYNTNLATVLHAAEEARSINILEERRAVFGANPLLPASVIAWVANA